MAKKIIGPQRMRANIVFYPFRIEIFLRLSLGRTAK